MLPPVAIATENLKSRWIVVVLEPTMEVAWVTDHLSPLLGSIVIDVI